MNWLQYKVRLVSWKGFQEFFRTHTTLSYKMIFTFILSMHQKKFSDWIQLKEKLHSQNQLIPLAKEGEIWWASLGENIGFEINGKSRFFSRPVIIVKKFARGFYLIIPVTSKLKAGTWYVPFKQNRIEMVACLHQVRSIDYRRMSSKLGQLDDLDFEKIKTGLRRLCFD